MSFTSDEMQRLQSYVNQDAEASALFQKLLHSQDMERHKICHEIRNPLTLLSGTLQLIESRHPERSLLLSTGTPFARIWNT